MAVVNIKMIENKYATALDDLEIEDPVKSFFDFCKERENIELQEKMVKIFHGAQMKFFKMEGF